MLELTPEAAIAKLAKLLLEKTDLLPNVVNPASKEIGNALGSLFHAAFMPIRLMSEKAEIYKNYQVESFAKEITSLAEQIPEKQLIMPRTSIAGSALENAKYCLDEEALRKMFVNLIVSSIDSEKQPFIRQSFAEVIKQLEPSDAKILIQFKLASNEQPDLINIMKTTIKLPCVNYCLKTSAGTLIINSNCYFTGNPDIDKDLQASSVTNLERLGLIKCSFTNHLEDSYYDIYRNNPEYLQLLYACDETIEPQIQKGVLYLTSLGKDFIKTCV